jgi:hypothetical protein
MPLAICGSRPIDHILAGNFHRIGCNSRTSRVNPCAQAKQEKGDVSHEHLLWIA